jgi:hypothetical protein
MALCVLIKLHFWASAYGVGLMVLDAGVGGFVQGRDLNDPTLAFRESTQSILPYLRGRSLSWMLLTVAHFVFAFHFGLMLLGFGRTASVPTFLNPLGSLNPQTDEDGGDAYPVPPKSGMAMRGARVYAANGCVYCHSQQVRPDYGGSDIERQWGERRSAPRDYIFEPIVLLGKMRIGPDLANVGHQPAVEEKKAAAAIDRQRVQVSRRPQLSSRGDSAGRRCGQSGSRRLASPALAATAAAPAVSPSSAANASAPPTVPPAGDQAAVTVPTSCPPPSRTSRA